MPCVTQALGIRVTAIGYYIKMTSDIRRNERQANEALMEQSKQLEAHAAEKAAITRASLEAAYAADLAALQKKQSEQLQAVQQRLKERLANTFSESLHGQVSGACLSYCKVMTMFQTQPSYRMTGCLTKQ